MNLNRTVYGVGYYFIFLDQKPKTFQARLQDDKVKIMVKGIIIISFSVFSIVLLLFSVWMNFTPGHFQREYCGCKVGYFTFEEMRVQEVRANQIYPVNGQYGEYEKPQCPVCYGNVKAV